MWVQPWLNSEEMTDDSCAVKNDKDQEKQEEETNEISAQKVAAANFFQQARGNIDAVMNQIPNLPPMKPVDEPEPPKKVEVKNTLVKENREKANCVIIWITANKNLG